MTKTTRKITAEAPDVVIDTVLTKQVAALVLSGYKNPEISRELNLTGALVKRITTSAEFKRVCEDVADTEIVPILAKARHALGKLVEKAVRVVEYHLDRNELDAAKLVFKSVGIESQEDKPGDTNLTVVLPGAQAPAVEVKHE